MNRVQIKGISKIQLMMAVGVIATLASFVGVAQAQTYPRSYRLSDKNVEQIIHSVERDAKTFRKSLDHALDQSRLDGTQREDNVNARVKDFEEATKQLHDHFDNHKSAAGDVQNVLDRASRIDEFMRRRPLDQRAQGNWRAMRGDLDRLASAYGVTWRWEQTYSPVETQTQAFRIDDRQVERLLRNMEKDANAFRHSLDHALDRSRLNGTAREDDVNQFVKDFDEATKQLRDRFNGHTSVAGDVDSVMTRAGRIDDFMSRRPLDRNAQRDWAKVRVDLDQLASAYNVSWNWSNRIR